MPCTRLCAVLLMRCFIPSPERFVQSASCAFGQRLMSLVSSRMKPMSRHAQERLELLMSKTADIPITMTSEGVIRCGDVGGCVP